jgi:uncharacterized protein YqeY
MAELKARLRTDLTTAMKARNPLVVSTLRMTLAAVRTAEVAGSSARELPDDEVLKVIGKEAKKRAESAEAFDAAGRGELATKERAEADVLAAYLPTQLTDDEVTELAARAVSRVAAESGAAPGMRQMGQVMALATGFAAGRADGARVSSAVRAQLQN